MTTAPSHLSGWTLRRHHAQEDIGDVARAHLADCGECRAKLSALADAQTEFEGAHPLPAFVAGVRAKQAPRADRSARSRMGTWAAAAAVLFLVSSPSLWSLVRPNENRLKGGADMELRIAGRLGGVQRVAVPGVPERLVAGERVRIGYAAGGHRYVAALSIDETGDVTPIYPERGPMLPAERSRAGATYLPGSLEFTGSGAETVVVVMGDQPLEMDALVRAARESYRRGGGKLEALPPLDIPGEQFRRQVLKP